MSVFKDDQTTYTGNLTVLGSISIGGSGIAIVGGAGTVNGVPIPFSTITNSLGGNVALNNTGAYFNGPSIAQGTAGTWFASGSVTVTDTVGAAQFNARLSDGTTVFASCADDIRAAGVNRTIALSGFIASPVGNIRIQVIDATSVNGLILFNVSGNAKDSTLSAIRIG